MNCNSSNWASGRTIRLQNGTQEIVCIINPNLTGTRPISVAVSNISSSNYQVLSKSYGTDPQVTFSGSNVSVKVPAHCYVVLGTTNVAGVEDIIADETTNKVKVYGTVGEIKIEGEYENASVYSLTGQEYHSLNVPAGIYIVNVDGKTNKVIVK